VVSKTKRGKAFKAVFDDYGALVRGISGVRAVVGVEWPGAEIVTFVDYLSEQEGDLLSDAMTAVVRAHRGVEPDFHSRWLGDARLSDFDLADADFIYTRSDGDEGTTLGTG
jgi:hypothetical protein